MKIYRVLGEEEYNQFCKTRSLEPHYGRGCWNRPERILNPERADDIWGKFFFFDLEDAVFFGFAFYGDRDNIIELEVDEEEALSCLACGTYNYRNSYCSPKEEYHFPELYLPYKFVDERVAEGRYRIIDYKERERIAPYPRPKHLRERHYTELGDAMELLASKRQQINKRFKEALYKRRMELNPDGNHGEPPPLSKEEREKIKAAFAEEVDGTQEYVDAVKKIFHEFAREHEKYRQLVPISKEDQ